MDFSSQIPLALPTFLVTLREGVEASLVVGIVLACLGKAQAQHLYRSVYLGILAGLGLSLLAGVGLNQVFAGLDRSPYGAVLTPGLQGLTCLVAIGLLSWMLVWMTQQAKGLKAAIESSVQGSLGDSGSAAGIFGIVFVAVLREGIETVLFVGGQFQAGWAPTIGAFAGLVGATAIGLLIFKGGVRLNLRRFFQVMGVLLLLIVAGLWVTALRKIDGAALVWNQLHPGVCRGAGACFLGPQVWDLSAWLPDRTYPGLLFKALFGYSQRLYLAQAIGYLALLLGVGSLYFRSLGGGATAAGRASTPEPATPEPATPEPATPEPATPANNTSNVTTATASKPRD
jgi:high-affinity iron transporter